LRGAAESARQQQLILESVAVANKRMFARIVG
jgi:hypothetical protein